MSKQTDLINIPDAITVDGSNNVGIGVVPKAWNVYDQALQIGDGAAIWTYQNAEAHYSVNSYYNSGNKYIGTGTALQYQQAAGAHSFKTATSGTADAAISWNTKVNIDSDGLKFNGDTAAANALSDYEEGTFNVVYNQGASGGTYDRQYGHYTKVGRVVHFEIDFKPEGWSTTTADIQIGGLPFTASATAGLYGFATINYQGQYLTTSDTGQISFHISANTSRITMYYPGGDGVGGNDVSDINGRLIISGRYFTDA